MSQNPIPITEEMIIAAAQRHHERTGEWPTTKSGDASEDFGFKVTWDAVTLSSLLHNDGHLDFLLAPLKWWSGIEPILGRALEHFVRSGRWPTRKAGGAVFHGSWVGVNAALVAHGYAPLPKQIQRLAQSVQRQIILRNVKFADIATAAQAHRSRTGRWPTGHIDRDQQVVLASSMVVTWGEVADAVPQGLGGMSLDEMLGLLIADYDGAEQEPSESSSAVEEGPTPLVADSLDPATWSKSVSLTNGQAKTFSFFQDGLSQDLAAKALRQDMASDKSFVGSLLRKQGLGQPSPLSAMLVRAAELPDGTWSVELRMQEGWQVYSTGFTQQEEATGAAEAICIRHYIQQRPPLFQPKPESATPTP